MGNHVNLEALLANTRRNGDCLEWQGSTNWNQRSGHGGYGVFNAEGKRWLAHRLVYRLVHDVELTREQHVCHSCDNPPCINPEHLWLGDTSSNMRDRFTKSGFVRRAPYVRKTTVAQRAEIVRRYERHSHNSSNARDLAIEFGISHSRIRQIIVAARRAA